LLRGFIGRKKRGQGDLQKMKEKERERESESEMRIKGKKKTVEAGFLPVPGCSESPPHTHSA